MLTTILRPNFEEPLDTAKQLVEQNITLYMHSYGESWKVFMLESNNSEYKILGENMIIADDLDHFIKMSEYDVIGNGTHAQLSSSLSLLFYFQEKLAKVRWYRSKEKFSHEPYGRFLSNKKWHLKEVITSIRFSLSFKPNSTFIFKEMSKHLLYFNQVSRY